MREARNADHHQYRQRSSPSLAWVVLLSSLFCQHFISDLNSLNADFLFSIFQRNELLAVVEEVEEASAIDLEEGYENAHVAVLIDELLLLQLREYVASGQSVEAGLVRLALRT